MSLTFWWKRKPERARGNEMTLGTDLEAAGKAILVLAENDALTTFGPAIVTFGTAVEAANGDPLKEAMAWLKFKVDLMAAAPNALGTLQGELMALVVGKVQALMAKAVANPPVVSPPVSGGVVAPPPSAGVGQVG